MLLLFLNYLKRKVGEMTKLSLDIFMLFFFLWLTKRYVQPYDIVIIVNLKCHYHCSVTLSTVAVRH